MDPCVAICVPIGSHPKVQFWRAFRFLQKCGGGQMPGVTHVFDIASYGIEAARRELTKVALAADPKVTHILMLDDDMTPQPDALARLLARDLPVVGGLCHSRRAPAYNPIMLRRHADTPEKPLGYGFIYDYEPGSLVEVDATGGAFLLVKREVFEAVSEKFGAEEWWTVNWPLPGTSEDIAFCERARACGYKVFVDTAVEVGHVAEVAIDSAVAKRLRTLVWNEWEPSK